MHKAFWDCLESQLKEDPPSYSHAVTLVGEIKEVRKESRLTYYDIVHDIYIYVYTYIYTSLVTIY